MGEERVLQGVKWAHIEGGHKFVASNSRLTWLVLLIFLDVCTNNTPG